MREKKKSEERKRELKKKILVEIHFHCHWSMLAECNVDFESHACGQSYIKRPFT